MRLILSLLFFFSFTSTQAFESPDTLGTGFGNFTSIAGGPQTSDMVLAEGFTFQYIAASEEEYDSLKTFRGRFDFTGFVPTESTRKGVLSINHELTPGGVTLMNLEFDSLSKRWQRSNVSPVDFSSLVSTRSNCSGTVTPWNTIITCEETITNTDQNSDGYFDTGWAVEIDPISRSVVNNQKLWAMGNFRHENAVVHGNLRTVYQGADAPVGYLFRFVADSAEDLSAGKLYAYKGSKSGTGEWILLKNSTPAERNSVNSQCNELGATVFNGIEDVEISPIDSMIYFAVKGENIVYRFIDTDPLNGTQIPIFETYVGGTGISYTLTTSSGIITEPWGTGCDNLAFDNEGNLFVLQDGFHLGSTDYNHLWMVGKNHTQANPDVRIFLKSPSGSEPTGITFTPDYKFMFLSFQHPSLVNEMSYLPDISGRKTDFSKDTAIAIARNEEWGSIGCDSLPQNITSLNNEYLYFNETRLTAQTEISSSQYVEFHAAESIQLNPGFLSREGSTFLAVPDGCQNKN